MDRKCLLGLLFIFLASSNGSTWFLSMYRRDLIDHFKFTHSDLSFVMSTVFFVSGVCAMITSKLCDLGGERIYPILSVSVAIMIGCLILLTFSNSMFTVAWSLVMVRVSSHSFTAFIVKTLFFRMMYFDLNKTILLTGLGWFVQMQLTSIMNVCKSHLDWKMFNITWIVISSVLAISGLLLCKNNRFAVETTEIDRPSYNHVTTQIFFISITVMLFDMCTVGTNLHMHDILTEHKIPSDMVSIVVTGIGCTMIFSLIILKTWGDMYMNYIWTVSIFFTCLSLAAAPHLLSYYTGIAGFSVIYGVSISNVMLITDVLFPMMATPDRISKSQGIFVMMSNIGLSVSPMWVHMLISLTESWDQYFQVSSLVMFMTMPIPLTSQMFTSTRGVPDVI